MATQRGCFGVVRSGPSSGAVGAVAEVKSWSFEESADREDLSVMGTCTKKFGSGPQQTVGTIEVYFDQDDARQADFVVGAEIAIQLYPGGQSAGKKYYSGLANIDSIKREGNVTSSVGTSFGWSVNGALTVATV